MAGAALAAVPIALQAGGMAYGAYSSNRQASRQNALQESLLRQARSFQQLGPTSIEQALLGMRGQDVAPFVPQTLDLGANTYGFNAGQDALMQMLRATPEGNASKSLNAVLEGGGNPFDTSALFEALGQVDQRNLSEQLTGLRGGASGLGQRFGSATQGAEVALRRGAAADTGARNAQIQAGSYESAQARMLQAASQLAAQDQFLASVAERLQQGGLGMGQLALQNTNATNAANAQATGFAQQERGFDAQLLSMLLNAEQARRQFNLATLGMGQGMQVASPQYGFGQASAELGQMMMLMQLLQGGGGFGGGTPTRTG